jgi:TatD DNase family protein
MLIDTHAHLTDDRLRNDLAAVLARAREFPSVSASAGIHPNHAAEANDGDWDTVVRLAADPAVVAIGETGLDRHWDFTPFPMQEDYFARHLQLSRSVNKPIVIHCREAEPDVVRMLRADFDAHGPIRGVMHSFCGSQATADAALEMGLFISFAGMLTYKNADDVRAVAATVPTDRLLVETDCPYLAPVPHRGKTNEPAFVAHTATKLAEIRGLTLSQLGDITTANAVQLFQIGSSFVV